MRIQLHSVAEVSGMIRNCRSIYIAIELCNDWKRTNDIVVGVCFTYFVLHTKFLRCEA